MKNRFVQVFWRDIAGIDSGEYSGAWFNKEQAMKYAQAVYDEYTYTV